MIIILAIWVLDISENTDLGEDYDNGSQKKQVIIDKIESSAKKVLDT